MLTILSEQDISKFISDLVADRKIDAAVAFWDIGAADLLGLDKSAGGRIVCNLESGCCNPDEVLNLLGRFDVRTNAKLHCTLYLWGDWAIVGSSNASSNRMAIEGHTLGRREINIGIDDQRAREQLHHRFETLWNESIDADARIVEKFRPLWNQKQRYRSDIRNGSLLSAIENDPGFFSDNPIFCLIWDKDITAKDLASLKNKEPAFTTNVYWPYQEWHAFPKNAWFLDISLEGPHPVVSGFGKTLKKPWRVKTPVGTFEIVSYHAKVEIADNQLTFGRGDRQRIGKHAQEFIAKIGRKGLSKPILLQRILP